MGIKFDEKTEAAIRTISANCPGIDVQSLVRSNEKWYTPKNLRELASRWPRYQREVMKLAVLGRSNPFEMIAALLPIYETVDFEEIPSRLHRALGSIRQEARLMDRTIKRNEKPNHLADRILTLDLIVEQATRLNKLLAGLETKKESVRDKKKSKKEGKKKSGSAQSKKKLGNKLHAAGGLGLIAKNVRNVAVLRRGHRPTPDEKALALRLNTESLACARQACDNARRTFGWADAACRVRSARTPTRRVITHADADADAIVSAWLAERFLFDGEPVEVMFVPRERVWGAWRVGDGIVDVGNTHDPGNRFFDHKPPACENRHDSCSALLIWQYLITLGRPVRHLKPLVDVVFARDSKRAWARLRDEYDKSERSGFLKVLDDAKAEHDSDAELYRSMRRWLDNHNRRTAR